MVVNTNTVWKNYHRIGNFARNLAPIFLPMISSVRELGVEGSVTYQGDTVDS